MFLEKQSKIINNSDYFVAFAKVNSKKLRIVTKTFWFTFQMAWMCAQVDLR